MSVCDLSVCPHDKIKTAETKIAKLGAGIVHHAMITVPRLPMNIRSKGHRVTKCITSQRDSHSAPSHGCVVAGQNNCAELSY